MKKHIFPFLLCLIFIAAAGIQFYENYLFRIQPPSKEWSKEVVVSRGKVKNTPKIIKYRDMYLVAHDDNDSIKIIMLDKLGKIVNEKVFPGGDIFLSDLNLLTDGSSIFINWIYSKGNNKNLVNLKLDKDFNQLDKWEIEDVRESHQISNNLMAISYPGKIEVLDVNKQSSTSIQINYSSKFASTKTKSGYLIVFYDLQNFKYITYNDDKLSGPELIMFRPFSTREMVITTAVACDDKNGYIFIDKRVKNTYGAASFITFPLEVDKNKERKLEGYGNFYYDPGVGYERDLRISRFTDFTYNPVSVSSGEKARLLVGAAREYGKSQRQFDIMDFTFKDGMLIDNTFIDKTREGTTMPWIDEDTVVFLNQTSFGQYNVCIASQSQEFKNANNGVRLSEIKLVLLDILTSIANSIVGLFTVGIRWILPVMILVSIATIFGYKLSLRNKKIIYWVIGAIAVLLKVIFAKNLFYGKYIGRMPGYLSSVSIGIIIFFVIGAISYGFGYIKYIKTMEKDPDILLLFKFILPLMLDSILTQFVYSPYIM